MTDIAIRVESLSKMYRIGAAEQRPQNLREALGGLLASPFAYLQRMMRPPSQEETLCALRDVSFEVKRGEVVGIPS
jgi:ABC-type polysaccharide/polyol phosphate transport system ATPase subunit